MNPDDKPDLTHKELDALLRAARSDKTPPIPTSLVEFGFETRVLARIREMGDASSWIAWAWKLVPFAAVLAVAAFTWSFVLHEEPPGPESLYDAVRLAGMPAIDFYMGGEE